ncbi:MAG: heme-binding protein [Methanomicrobiales archaeon]|jgi:hypothetical protein|nr:heme-binding protein [Methanomicrobiales archaeon]
MAEMIQGEDIGRIGDIELRRYPDIPIARTSGAWGEESFSILYRYITGENLNGSRIQMTAPVINDAEGMSFVLPLRFLHESPPKPVDQRVELRTIKSREVAVLRFRGYAYPQVVSEMSARLLPTLERHGIAHMGEPFLMRYNSPMVPGFLRRNEVGIEIAMSRPD